MHIIQALVSALAVFAVIGCAVAQPPADPGDGAESAGPESTGSLGDLTCEVTCSETELRTAIARISWTGPAASAAGASGPVVETLQTTVYKGGFDRDLYASFPLTDDGSGPQTPSDPLPAYDLEILEVVRPTDRSAPEGADERRATVEIGGLEAGMKYTWRVVVETAAGELVSDTVTCEAPVCTADDASGGPSPGS